MQLPCVRHPAGSRDPVVSTAPWACAQPHPEAHLPCHLPCTLSGSYSAWLLGFQYTSLSFPGFYWGRSGEKKEMPNLLLFPFFSPGVRTPSRGGPYLSVSGELPATQSAHQEGKMGQRKGSQDGTKLGQFPYSCPIQWNIKSSLCYEPGF